MYEITKAVAHQVSLWNIKASNRTQLREHKTRSGFQRGREEEIRSCKLRKDAAYLFKNSSSTTAEMSRSGFPIPSRIPSYAICAIKELKESYSLWYRIDIRLAEEEEEEEADSDLSSSTKTERVYRSFAPPTAPPILSLTKPTGPLGWAKLRYAFPIFGFTWTRLIKGCHSLEKKFNGCDAFYSFGGWSLWLSIRIWTN